MKARKGHAISAWVVIDEYTGMGGGGAKNRHSQYILGIGNISYIDALKEKKTSLGILTTGKGFQCRAHSNQMLSSDIFPIKEIQENEFVSFHY